MAKLGQTYPPLPSTTRGEAIVISADAKGTKLLYCNASNVVIRDIKEPSNAELYTEHAQPTTVAKFAPSGFYIASADKGGTVKIWDTTNSDHIMKFECKAIGGKISDLAWSPDNTRIVAVGDGKENFGKVFMWDSGNNVGEVNGHTKRLVSVDYKPTRPFRMISSAEDFLVCHHQGPPFKFLSKHEDHTNFPNCVRYSPDGEKAVSVGSDKKIFLYDAKSGEKTGEIQSGDGHTGTIYSVSWSPDSKKFATSSADKTVKIWNVEGSTVEKTFSFGNDTTDMQVSVLWTAENALISVSLSGVVNYLDINSGDIAQRLHGHSKNISALTSSSEYVFSGSMDGVIVAWDIATSTAKPITGSGHTNQVTGLAYVPEDNTLVSVGWDDSIIITPVDKLEFGAKVPLGKQPTGLSASKGGLAAVSTNDSVIILRNGNKVCEHAVKYSPRGVAISVDQTEIAVAGDDNNLHVYALSGDAVGAETVLEGHRGGLTAVTYSADGRHIASCDQSRGILVWDRSTHKVVEASTEWVAHTARVNSLSFSPDGTKLVTGSLDQQAIVWNLEKPNEKTKIPAAHNQGVNAVRFVTDTQIATGGMDCCVRTWNL